MKKWRRLLHEWDPPGASDDEQDDDDDADHMHTPSGRKRTRGERSSKACSPDENVAPKRQTLSGGGANDDLYGGMLYGWCWVYYVIIPTKSLSRRVGGRRGAALIWPGSFFVIDVCLFAHCDTKVQHFQ